MNKSDNLINLRENTYEILDQIGQGAYGIVWRVRRSSDGEIVTLKAIQTHNPYDRTPYPTAILRKIIQVLRWEIEFLRRIGPEQAQQQNILPLLDSGEYEDKPVMVLPLCENSLNHIYVQRRDETGFPFDTATLLRWTDQIARALAVIHNIRVEEGAFIHRDLKFTNILVKNKELFVCDFGTVKIVEHGFTTSLAGTLEWGAPETFIPREISDGKPRYELTPAVDMYSLGLLIHALITGNFPSAQGKIQDQTAASGKPMPGAEEKFGTVGGLTDEERTVLLRDLRLLLTQGQTLVQQEFLSLPDTEVVIEKFAELTETLLSPLAEHRPDAQEVRARIKGLQDYLSPDLSVLEISMSEEAVPAGSPCVLRITAQGRGLPENGRWFSFDVEGKHIEPSAVREIGDNVWELTLPPFRHKGEYEVRVSAVVNHQKITDNKEIKVSPRLGKLWRKKNYTDELIRSPDRSDWLDSLDKKAKRSRRFRRKYLQILEAVRSVHTDHVDINRRYWNIRHLLEGKKDKKRLGFSRILILLILIAGAYFWMNNQDQDIPLTPPGDQSQTDKQKRTEDMKDETGDDAEKAEPEEDNRTWKDTATGMEFVLIPGGSYKMGCTRWTDNCESDERPAHEVHLDEFWMGKYEVTQGEWEKIMGKNPSRFKKGERYPVERVSWNDIKEFIRKLNWESGENYRLPTEAEWEYACRSLGKREKYCGGDKPGNLAWYDKNSLSFSHPAGRKASNSIGLYDMSGNVWEWCEDRYGGYSSDPVRNPDGPLSGDLKVFRGGGWSDDARYCRAANRSFNLPDYRSSVLGFRLVRR
ncbi:SUMF1/EgtB/PvdO family nonheme iron enzyme [Desulfococcaceae bacterium HSG8]|nr:SUMF1/EgtB/PvdO family nonheme iron enzyme [Desulfococcaceae bacterium HSG8]